MDKSPMLDQPVSVRRGEELNIGHLRKYLEKNLHLAPFHLVVQQFPNGYSNLTYLIKMDDRELILRRPPVGARIKSGHDMGREFKILSALSTTYEKVPRPLMYCSDESVLGAPFYLMQRTDGVILRPKMPAQIQPDAKTMQGISRAFVDTLVEIHQIDYREVGLDDLGKPDGYVHRQITGWAKRYEQAKTHDIQEIHQTMTWLFDHIPGSSGSALIHNDFKYDNLVLDANDLCKVIAVLDWEMSTLGDPLMDLGTALGYWVNINDPEWMQRLALSPTTVPGNPSRAEIAQQYAEKSQIDLSEIVFYYVFGLFKISVITQQIYHRYKRGLTQDKRFASLCEVVKGLGTMATLAIDRKQIDDLF